ncbi:YtxH domain-containing protein, partial [Bifidobacterium longum]|nr:YtxH domain-containing protein [Bifidobacterium longum]
AAAAKEDIMIDIKDTADQAGSTVKEGIDEAKPVAEDAKILSEMAKEDAATAKEDLKDTFK